MSTFQGKAPFAPGAMLGGDPSPLLGLGDLHSFYKRPGGGVGGGGGGGAAGGVQLGAAALRLLGDAAPGLTQPPPPRLEQNVFARAAPLAATDVRSFLQHHHDLVVAKAVEEACAASLKHSEQHQRARESEQWRRERAELLAALGVTFSHVPAPASGGDMVLAGGGGSAHALTGGAGGGGSGGGWGGGGQLAVAPPLFGGGAAPSAAASTLGPTGRAYAVAVQAINEQRFGRFPPE
jgi:hypothetical protein